MTEQRVVRKAAGNGTLEHSHVVDPLPRESPLAKQVLIHVGHGRRVGIHAGMSREDRRVARSIGAGQRHADARLHDAVAFHHPAKPCIEDGTVERMRHRANQRRCGVARQHGVGVKRDDVPHSVQPVCIALDRGKRLGPRAKHEAVELHELSALALPSHPDAVRGIAPARPQEQQERRSGLALEHVELIERLHAIDRCGNDRCIARQDFSARIHEIAQHGKPDFRITIGEVLCLEVIECFLNSVRSTEKDGDHYNAAVPRRHAGLERHARQSIGREQECHHLVHDRHGHVGCR